jgi:hypothetical protein
MAPRRKEEPTNGNGKGKIKFRYTDEERTVQFSMENITSESVVSEGLRGLANALAGRNLTDPARRLPKNTGGSSAAVIDLEEETETPEQEEALDQEETDVDDQDGARDAAAKPKKVAKPKAPKLLPTPVLSDAKVSLADFMAQKGATEMMDKYAVVAVWYKEQFQITDMNIDRIFTAFKHLGQESQLPTAIAKPLSNLTYNRKWFDKGKTPGTFTINWLGEDSVGKMKPGATK